MRNVFKFSLIEIDKQHYMQAVSAQAKKLCIQEELGGILSGKQVISIEDFKGLQEKFGSSVKSVSSTDLSDSPHFSLWQEPITKMWTLYFLDENGEELRPAITGNTKFEALCNALHNSRAELEKANGKLAKQK